MTKCIYRGIDLNKDCPDNDNTATVEHIIPWALGGSNGFVTCDVSKKANNDLGSQVDAQFANTLPIAMKRHQLQLKSQNGNIPPIIWRGTAPDGHAAVVTIHADKKFEVDFLPKVTRHHDVSEPGPMSISGSRERVMPILEGVLKGMKKRGHSAYSEDGLLLSSLDDFLKSSTSTLVDEVSLSIEYFNQEIWTRGILKIALAAGHKILGYDWTAGAPPRGFIAGELSRGLRLAVGKTAKTASSHQHIVSVLPADHRGAGILVVSLFGGVVPEALIAIGSLPESFCSKLNSENNLEALMGYRIDPITRATTPILFAEIDRRIATQGPTNKRTRAIGQDRRLR